MYANPEDWLALTENYRSMSDEQLLELAVEFGDLTPTAQQVLRDEMKLRKLGDPQTPDWGRTGRDASKSLEEIDGDADEELAGGDVTGVEYTWKTPLCDCDSREQAWQLTEMLRRAGIESWLEGQGRNLETVGARILVAADQLDEARMVIARPVPQDIVDVSQETDPGYELPSCPKCGAADPVLESVEPVNTWSCESCGAEWADEVPDGEQEG